MTDREMLLIAYGAMKVMEATDAQLLLIIEAHLFGYDSSCEETHAEYELNKVEEKSP